MKQEHNPVGRPALPEKKKAAEQIQLRVKGARKASYVRAANKKQQSLAAWMFEQCDAASGYTGGE